jgi:hypothetical protein
VRKVRLGYRERKREREKETEIEKEREIDSDKKCVVKEFDENRTRNVQSRGDNVNHSSNSSTTKTQVKYSN